MIDRKKLRALMAGDQDLADKIIQAFKDFISSDLLMMQEDLAGKKTDNLSNSAHQLKTLAGYMGLNRLLELAAQLEVMAERNDEISKLEKQYELLKSEIGIIAESEGWQ